MCRRDRVCVDPAAPAGGTGSIAVMYDLIIVGGGTAGASAAVFAGRAGLSTVVIDADKGLTRRAMLNNHLGFPDGIPGPELVDLGRRHAEKSGAEWVEGSVTQLQPEAEHVAVITDDGTRREGLAVLLAVGVNVTLADEAGITTIDGREPGIPTTVEVDAEGRTNVARIWAAGTAANKSVHTIITAGDGARVAVNIISEQRGERHVDHDMMPKD